jgi:GTP-binding protein HflX
MSSGNSQLLNTNEKVIVVGVGLKSDMLVEIKENLCELEELVTSAGGEIVGNIFQILPQWNPATLIGSGKSEEIKQMVAELSATAVIFDHHLSGVQARNLQNLFNVN